jgi:glycosyltransferase involved in cell wall biosynthesis
MSQPLVSPAVRSDLVQRKLRIAVFNRTFSPTGGGAERYSIALVEQLSLKHEIHVYAQEISHQWPGVTYHRVSAPLLRPRWVNQLWFATATWWATRRGFDVVHSHENTWHGDVQTVHVLPVKYNLFHDQSGWHYILRWVKVMSSPRLLTYLGLERLRYAPRPGRQVVVTSESLKAIMLASYPVCHERVSVITPGITLPTLPASCLRKAQTRASMGLPATAPCLLFVGNDYYKKGLQTVLDALAKLPADVVLAVVGNRAHIPAFRELSNTLKLGARVFFLGPLKDVGPAYEAADCLVHPTREDTFAMVVLESMAYGLPVVVSGPLYCGISGLLQNGVNAMILDDPRDASHLAKIIDQVLGQSGVQQALNNRLRKGSAEFSAHYQWLKIALKQDAIYFSVHAAKKAAGMR